MLAPFGNSSVLVGSCANMSKPGIVPQLMSPCSQLLAGSVSSLRLDLEGFSQPGQVPPVALKLKLRRWGGCLRRSVPAAYQCHEYSDGNDRGANVHQTIEPTHFTASPVTKNQSKAEALTWSFSGKGTRLLYRQRLNAPSNAGVGICDSTADLHTNVLIAS